MAIVWAVNGAKFDAASARAETFKSTSGARGVTLPGDLKVSALPTPGTAVRVVAGGATMPAGYPSAPGQSYGTYEATSKDVPVVATGSGGTVTKYLIQRITDPQYEGAVPADPVNAAYDSYVWVTSLTGLNYPYVPLVRLAQPANTATITNAMLTDIRKLANPREWREVQMEQVQPINQEMHSQTYIMYPNTEPYFEIPEWATRAFIQFRLSGVANMEAAAEGFAKIGIAPLGGATSAYGPELFYEYNAPDGGTQTREELIVSWRYDIPAADRGQMRVLRLYTRRVAGVGSGYFRTHGGTQAAIDIQFYERII